MFVLLDYNMVDIAENVKFCILEYYWIILDFIYAIHLIQTELHPGAFVLKSEWVVLLLIF